MLRIAEHVLLDNSYDFWPQCLWDERHDVLIEALRLLLKVTILKLEVVVFQLPFSLLQFN